jgi:hypothetical protein
VGGRETGKRPIARSAERSARWSRTFQAGLRLRGKECRVAAGGLRAQCADGLLARVGTIASVGGRRAEVKRRRGGAYSGARPERNGTGEPQTEASADPINEHCPVRDEREFGGAEQARSRGDGAATERAWSAAKLALVTAAFLMHRHLVVPSSDVTFRNLHQIETKALQESGWPGRLRKCCWRF